MTRKASCCCGACRVEIDGDPVLNGICPCGNCKRRTGAAGGCFADPTLPEPSVTVANDGRCVWLVPPADWRTAL